jgi:hypothetical protein
VELFRVLLFQLCVIDQVLLVDILMQDFIPRFQINLRQQRIAGWHEEDKRKNGR